MKTADGIAWFKPTFGDRIAAGFPGAPLVRVRAKNLSDQKSANANQ
jgi:hypothetical protein